MGMRHLIVLNKRGMVVGMITRKDLCHLAHVHHDSHQGHGNGHTKDDHSCGHGANGNGGGGGGGGDDDDESDGDKWGDEDSDDE
jgi:hypothetical protein